MKLAKYLRLQESYTVGTICVETLGAWRPNGLKFMEELGEKMKRGTKEPRSLSYLYQAIGVAIQRGNAESVMGMVIPSKNLEETYYI